MALDIQTLDFIEKIQPYLGYDIPLFRKEIKYNQFVRLLNYTYKDCDFDLKTKEGINHFIHILDMLIYVIDYESTENILDNLRSYTLKGMPYVAQIVLNIIKTIGASNSIITQPSDVFTIIINGQNMRLKDEQFRKYLKKYRDNLIAENFENFEYKHPEFKQIDIYSDRNGVKKASNDKQTFTSAGPYNGLESIQEYYAEEFRDVVANHECFVRDRLSYGGKIPSLTQVNSEECLSKTNYIAYAEPQTQKCDNYSTI